MMKTERLKEVVRKGKDAVKEYAPKVLMITVFGIGCFAAGVYECSRLMKEDEDKEVGDFSLSIAKDIDSVIHMAGEDGARWMSHKALGPGEEALTVKDLGRFGEKHIEMDVDPDQKVAYAFAIGVNKK